MANEIADNSNDENRIARAERQAEKYCKEKSGSSVCTGRVHGAGLTECQSTAFNPEESTSAQCPIGWKQSELRYQSGAMLIVAAEGWGTSKKNNYPLQQLGAGTVGVMGNPGINRHTDIDKQGERSFFHMLCLIIIHACDYTDLCASSDDILWYVLETLVAPLWITLHYPENILP